MIWAMFRLESVYSAVPITGEFGSLVSATSSPCLSLRFPDGQLAQLAGSLLHGDIDLDGFRGTPAVLQSPFSTRFWPI